MEEAQEILRQPIHVKEETKQQEEKQEKRYEPAYERERQKTKKKKKYRGKNKGRNRTNQIQTRNGEDGQERSTEARKTGGNRAVEFRRAQTQYNRQSKPKQTSPRSPEKNDKETQKNAQEEMEP